MSIKDAIDAVHEELNKLQGRLHDIPEEFHHFISAGVLQELEVLVNHGSQVHNMVSYPEWYKANSASGGAEPGVLTVGAPEPGIQVDADPRATLADAVEEDAGLTPANVPPQQAIPEVVMPKLPVADYLDNDREAGVTL